LPDADPPSYLASQAEGPVSLQAMCHGAVTWQRLEELERAGARGLMVLAVERSLA
jgi:ATP phosphoribosyltransferase